MSMRGADIDIRTGRPLEEAADGRKAEEQAQEEAILKAQAQWLGISESAEGQKLVELICRRLEARLRTLLQNDPQAQALIDLLSDLGLKDNAAHSAVAQLASMKVGRGKRFEWRYDET